jgi:hypothetical protein
MNRFLVMLLSVAAIAIFNSCTTQASAKQSVVASNDTILYPEEKHLANVQQLTFGGDNAEAYFSYDGKWIIFQRTSVKSGVPAIRCLLENCQSPAKNLNIKW